MINPYDYIQKAKKSNFHLWLLNVVQSWMIPFNGPHGFEILEIGDEHIKTSIPYKRRNLNHIKGLHACALATLSEFSTGMLLVGSLDPTKYRIILQNLEMKYHYQGKMSATASFSFSKEDIESKILVPLQNSDSTIIECVIAIHDRKQNHICTGHVHWQIKDWSKVKTKM